EPAGDDGTYFHRFTVPFGASFGRILGAKVSDGGKEVDSFDIESDVVAFGYGDGGPVDAEVVFAGYGITTDAEDRKSGLDYDDYRGVDVKGKAVLILRFVPWGERGPFGGRRSPHATLVSKLRNARDHGAAGAILVTPPAAVADVAAEADLHGV